MIFFLGFLVGLLVGILLCILVMVTLTYFKRYIEQKLEIIEKVIENEGPAPKGYIIEPRDEAEEVREKIIERNRRQGRSTPISELR